MSSEFVLAVPGGVLSGRRADPPGHRLPGRPLIVALHGGSYSSAYFDVPGFSLLDRAAGSGCPAIAVDRPGYRASTPVEAADLLAANAEVLDAAIDRLYRREAGDGASGVVLVGHSIGGAISLLLAARRPRWPLLGIAVSGVALSLPPAGPGYEEARRPTVARIRVPDEVMSAAMFGPPTGYAPDAPQRAAVAHEPVVYREILEINSQWPARAQDVYAGVRVPVHLRLGEHDVMWARGEDEVARVRQALSNAPSVDARLVEGVGHAIDFHHAGAAMQEEQITFAITCATAAGGRTDPGR